jgi:predicted AlkP superfamily phosphohydrolase/phosphomutase
LDGIGGERGRVIVFGIDGGDWRVIDPLIAGGRMPAMARVVREGASGVLMSMEPSASPSLWTTIATGVGPDRHGIHGFIVPGPSGGTPGSPEQAGEAEAAEGGGGTRSEVRPVTSGMRRAPAFWNILGRFDRRSGVVGWLVTWPAEPINGYVVSSYLPYLYNWSTGRPLKGTIVEGIPHQTFPAGLLDEVAPLKVRPTDLDPAFLRRFYDPARIGSLRPEDRECVTGFRWSVACDETYARVGRRLFEKYPVDLFAIYFGGSDVASHRFWKFAHPEAMPYGVHPDDAAILGGVIDAYYVYLDGLLGEYLARMGPDDTVVVLSDHGFKPVMMAGRPNTSGHHRPEGIVAFWGRGVRPGARIEGARLVDILPTLLQLLDLPAADGLEGRALSGALDPAFSAAHPPRHVPDYGDLSAPHGPEASGLDQNVLERLRSLGYID